MNTRYLLLSGMIGLLAACSSDGSQIDTDTGTDESTTIAATSESSGGASGGGSTTGSTGVGGTQTSLTSTAESTDESSGTESGGPTDAPFTIELIAGGFAMPESAHFHVDSSQWFVSNISGASGDPDGEGWVSRLDRDGQILDEQWVSGLDSPAGVTSNATRLYVADINRVHVYDLGTAEEVDTIEVATAGFLNDVAFGADETLYVTDSFGQAVYALAPGEAPAIVVQDDALDFPNGILWRDEQLWVASIGPFEDFTVDGPMHMLDPATGELQVVAELRGKFDGMAEDDDGLWITDFRGRLIRWEDGAEAMYDLGEHGLMSSADLGYDVEQSTLLIPDLIGNQLALVRLGGEQ